MDDTKAESIDLSRALNRSHENKWVALTPDYSEVVAASDDLVKLDKAVAGRDVVYHRVLPASAPPFPLVYSQRHAKF
jgi:hypothetical protein